MYLAHSTSTSSCSFMDSHTSAMLAIFFARMSPLIPETGEVICERQGSAWGGRTCHFLLFAQGPPLECLPVQWGRHSPLNVCALPALQEICPKGVEGRRRRAPLRSLLTACPASSSSSCSTEPQESLGPREETG
jgi:hypothetical protein